MESRSQLSSQEQYEDHVLTTINTVVDVLEERRHQDTNLGNSPRELSNEQYLGVAQSVVASLLERENVERLNTEDTYETGEFQEISHLVQSVPGIAEKAVKKLDEELAPEASSADLSWREATVSKLVAFSEVFEGLIVDKVFEEKEE